MKILLFAITIEIIIKIVHILELNIQVIPAVITLEHNLYNYLQ